MSDEMRILTVRQPWAWAIIHGGKDVENRVRNIAGDYRGPIAIHAGLAKFEDDGQYREVTRSVVSELNGWPADDGEMWGADLLEPDDPRFIFGAIIGVVDLDGVHEGHNTERSRMKSVQSCYRPMKPFGPCSSWALPDSWHLELANPRPLTEPIRFKGALGLRRLPADVIDQIKEQLK